MIGLGGLRDTAVTHVEAWGLGIKSVSERSSGSGPTAVSPLVYHWVFLGLV